APAAPDLLPCRLVSGPVAARGLPLGHQPVEAVAELARVAQLEQRLALADHGFLLVRLLAVVARALGVVRVAALENRVAGGREAGPERVVDLASGGADR